MLELDSDQRKEAFYNVIRNSCEALTSRGFLRVRADMDDAHYLGLVLA